MALENTSAGLGLWFFRHRSYLALAALPIVLVGFRSYTYLAGSHQVADVWQLLCFAISICGLALRVLTIGCVPRGTSSRRTRELEAVTLNTTGTYSLVRHPLYLGNYLAMLGCLLFFHRIWIVLAGTGLFILLYRSITLAEEAFLRERFGPVFENWAKVTPAWIPKLAGWEPPDLPFCWRTVLAREYTGLFVVFAAFFLLDFIGDWIVSGQWHLDAWGGLLAVGAITYTTLRTLKRHTRILEIEGR